MALDLRELNVIPDNSNMNVNPRAGNLMYYRKPEFLPGSDEPLREAGWVDIGEANPLERVRKTETKGDTPLPQYGRFNHLQDGVSVTTRKFWHILTHPSRTGPLEFPVSQIVELGWADKSPYGLKITFPQLADVTLFRKQCSICRHRKFTALTEEEAQRQLNNHQQIAHAKESQNERLAEVLSKAQQDVQGPLAEVLGMLVQGQQQQAKLLDALTNKLLGEMKQK